MEREMNSIGSLDRYLCAVFTLKEQYFCVRSVDVAHFLHCSRATVSASIRKLTEARLIAMESNGALELTKEGAARAKAYQDRFSFFHSLLCQAGLSPADAEKDASALTRTLSEQGFRALRAYWGQLSGK